MKKEQRINRIRLGAFVLAGTALLLLGLYYIGSQKNIFHFTIKVNADFNDVAGLMPGNNVQFNGINVGTVSKVFPIADTIIRVEFTIDAGTTQFIADDATVSIGTDGLLGNKMMNISPGTHGNPSVEEGSTLRSNNPFEMENAMRTLDITGENLKVITDNLRNITDKLDNNSSLWNLLSDSVLAENVRSAVVGFQITGESTAIISGDLSKIVSDIRLGKGTVGALLTDTLISHKLNQTIVNIQAVSDSVAMISGDFRIISQRLKNGEGSIGTLLTDTTFVHNLNESMININKGSVTLNENLEALKLSWPFKKYFKKQEKEK